MQTILFICTGNYHRSRTAEELFNDAAKSLGLPWQAYSRGIQAHLIDVSKRGALSPFAIHFLESQRIPIRNRFRLPQLLQEGDFFRHDRIICLDEKEHRPMMQSTFPQQLKRVDFWQVADVPIARPEEALPRVQAQVMQLVSELALDAETEDFFLVKP